MSTVYGFICEYDDLYKFRWPVVLADARLWLGVECLRDLYELPPSLPLKTMGEIGSLATWSDDIPAETLFCRADDLRRAVLTSFVSNDNFHTVLEHYLFLYLPRYFSKLTDRLMLTTIFDIADFWELMEQEEFIKKYWLFRYKIVTMKHETETKKQQNDAELENDAELAPKNRSSPKNGHEFGIKNNDDVISTIMKNIQVQFMEAKKYKEENKMIMLLNFNKLIKGSVGLLEYFLEWN